MNKIEEIKKELEKNLGYNFNNWGKGDLQMLKEIINANDKVVKNLDLCAVSQQSELLSEYENFKLIKQDLLQNRSEFISEFLKERNCG
jgi:thermostable 8-oxoguanine DNA glycosylase